MSGLRTVHDLDLDRVEAARNDEEAMSWLRSGDILVARRESSWTSRVIGALDGYWSHSALYVGDGELVEAGINGATITPITIFRSRFPDGVAAIRVARRSEDGAGAAAWARKLANGPDRGRFSGFDLGLALLMLRRARGRQALAALASVNDAGLDTSLPPFTSTCSSLVYHSFRPGSGVELAVRVPPDLELVNGELRFGPEDEIADLVAPIEGTGHGPAGPTTAGDGHLGHWSRLLAGLRRAAAGAVAADTLNSIDVADGVTPGDLWMIDKPDRRWLFRPSDASRAGRQIDQANGAVRTTMMSRPPATVTTYHTEAAAFRLDDPPEDVVASVAARDEWRAGQAGRNASLAFIAGDVDRWPSPSTVTVAFLGGTVHLHHRIAEAAGAISESCGLTLDFGHDPDTGRYRSWAETDTTHAADIRVGFDQPGHWSLAGTASIDRSVGVAGGAAGGRPGQRSLNLHGFDRELPVDWAGTVLRVFLQAIAFHHDHQNRRGPCRTGFRWEDDDTYQRTVDRRGVHITDPNGRRAGIYTYLSGAPNQWSRAKVDRRLRSTATDGPAAYPLDPASAMLYRFPELFYRQWPSPCAPTSDGQTLSDGDRRGLDLLYPTVAGASQRYPLAIALASAALTGPGGGGGRRPHHGPDPGDHPVPDDDHRTAAMADPGPCGDAAHAAGMYAVLRELSRRVVDHP
ncbi:MAG: hypothetical protein ACK5RL_18380 [Acidimicrobiales bacterium]